MSEHQGLSTPSAGEEVLLTIQTGRRKTLGLCALALSLAIPAGILSLTAGRTESPVDEAGNVIFTVGMLTLVVVFGVPKLLTTRPALVVSHEGLRLGQSRLGLDLLPWVEIRRLTMFRMYGQAVLEIQVAHPETLVAGLSERQRVLCRLRYPQLSSAGILTLPGSTMAMPLGKVLVEITRRFGEELKQYDVKMAMR